MSTVVYLNGQYLPLSSAAISPLDRGFLFGDGVYEVIPVYQKIPFRLNAHLDRLAQSLKALNIQNPYTNEEWEALLHKLIESNPSQQQALYIQVTRGTEPKRAHAYQDPPVPTVFAMTEAKDPLSKTQAMKGLKLLTVSDLRWKYCHIKTTARVAYVLMAQEAKAAGYDEALITNHGNVLEGATSNIFIVRHGIIYTPPESHGLLSGITRSVVLEIAEKNQIPYRESKISERDCQKADEIWITSSTRGVLPVITLDDQPVGNGQAGPLWERLWELYVKSVNRIPELISH